MRRVGAALRGNAHALNYVLFGTAALVPVLIYANTKAPTSEQIESALSENFAEDVHRARNATANIGAFWAHKRSEAEMEGVYSQLLRSGKSTAKRHYELTGTLADLEARENPQAAQMQRILALAPPPGDAEATQAGGGEGGAGEKAATGQAPHLATPAAANAPSAPAASLPAAAPPATASGGAAGGGKQPGQG